MRPDVKTASGTIPGWGESPATKQPDPGIFPGCVESEVKAGMNTDAWFYSRWQRDGSVSRFMIGPGLALYRVEEIKLIGGSLFVASTLDTGELVGQFESEQNAQRACARCFAQKREVRSASGSGNGLKGLSPGDWHPQRYGGGLSSCSLPKGVPNTGR